MLKVFFLIFFFLSNFCIAAAGILDAQPIRDNAKIVIDNSTHPENGPITSFIFQQFIKNSQLPLRNQELLKNVILELRDLYRTCARILKEHLGEINFLKEKLIEAEIRFLNQFHIAGGSAFNNSDYPAYQAAINNVTRNFSRMVGKITVTNEGGGSVTGTLFPIQTADGGYEWAVLTCAHIMDCINKKDHSKEVATFTLEGVPPIPLRAIKIFKRENRESRSIAINTNGEINSEKNTLDLEHLARALPRYDKEGDIAICYLAPRIMGAMATQTLLKMFFPVADVCFQNNQTAFNIINQGVPISVRFHQVTNAQTDIPTFLTSMNAHGRNQIFILGYPGFNSHTQTLSIARPLVNDLNPHAISMSDQFSAPVNEHNFYFDAPIYHGMSGGPIFALTPGNPNIIDIYGIVRALNFGNLTTPYPSRYEGTFLK